MIKAKLAAAAAQPMTPPAASPPAAAVAHSALALAAHRERQQRCGGPNVVWVPYVDTLVDKARYIGRYGRDIGEIWRDIEDDFERDG